MTQVSKYFIGVFIGTWLISCSSVTHMFKDLAKVKKIYVESDENVNDSTSTTVDVVFILNKSVEDKMPDNAVDWFNQKQSLLIKYGKNLSVASFQIPPNFPKTKMPLPGNHDRARRAILYANYLASEGQAPIDISQYKRIVVTLKKSTLVLKEN